MIGGWKKEPFKFKDYSYHKIYGAAPTTLTLEPFETDVSGLPIVFQGVKRTCVDATVTFIKQLYEKQSSIPLSHEYLAVISGTEEDGATLSQVLNAAYNIGICEQSAWIDAHEQISEELAANAEKHRLAGYAFLHNLSPQEIYQAIKQHGAILVGVDSYQGSEPHVMAADGIVLDNGKLRVKCANWWDSQRQGVAVIDFEDIKAARVILKEKPQGAIAIPFLEVLKSKWSFIPALKKLFVGLVVFSIAALGLSTKVSRFGSAGVFDKFAIAIAGSGISATDTFVPLTTFTAQDGSVISTSTIKFPIYVVVNPTSNTDREKIECSQFDATNLKLTSCNRAISCDNLSNSTSTIVGGAYPHPAGEPVILSNDNCFFNRFVDTFSSQDVGGTKQFTTSTVSIGDNTSSTEKKLIYRVGLSNNTYLGFYGPNTGNTTGTAVLNLGAGEFQLSASGTTVGVEANGGLHLTSGLLGVNTSSTQAVATDTLNNIVLLASSTPSTNGGFLNFVTSTNALGRLFWDVRSFLAGAWTWVGNQIFTGTVTFNGNATSTAIFAVQSPTSTFDATNKGYVDNSLSLGVATGTAGAAITAGQALYMSTTSTLFQTNSGVASSTYQFVGVAITSVAANATVSYSRPSGINCNQSGLSAGYNYYLNGTNGQLSTTAGTKFARIGRALTASCLQLLDPKYIETGTVTISATGNTTVTTFFYPATIIIKAGDAGVGGQTPGFSIGDDTNVSVGAFNTSNAGNDNTKAWKTVNSAGTTNAGTVSSKTATGFVLNTTTANVNANLFYTAYSE